MSDDESLGGWKVELQPGRTVITGDAYGLRGLRSMIDAALEKGEVHASPLRASDATMTVRCTKDWAEAGKR